MLKIIGGRSKPQKNIAAVINQNNSLIFIVCCYIIGILAGVMLFKYKGSDNFYKEEFNELIGHLSGGFFYAVLHSFLSQLPYIAAVFLAGSCMVGGIIVPCAVGLRGASYGIIMSYAYYHYGLTGIIFNLLILLPAAVLSAIALILSAREALGFSLALTRLAIPSTKNPEIDKDFKLYCLRQLFVLIFFLVSALTEGLMSVSFIQFFKL